MYSRISADEWPVGHKWGVLLALYRALRDSNTQYSVQVEELLFATRLTPEHQPRYYFTLTRWNRDPSIRPATQREVLGTYTDIDELIGVMKLIVSNEKEKLDERRA